jgi:Ca2+-binding EF-hand superfamily protein
VLDPNEIQKAFCNIVETNEDLEKLLREYDVNNAGVIDFEEFVDMIRTPTI